MSSGGSRRTYDIIDFTLPSSVAGATAVALNVTSVGAITPGFIQVVPFLAAPLGGSSSINVSVAALPIPNFVIVPLGASQKISVYVPTGGNIALDLLGSFQPTTIAAPPAAGRFVPINPERQLDTRSTNLVPAGWVAHKPNNENVVLKLPVTSAVPAAGVAALVLNVTSTQADAAGWLRAQPSGTTPLTTSTVNYVKNTDSANTVIVPLGADGTVTIYTSVGSHIIADVAGYITSGTAPVSSQGLFVPVITTRTYDSRNPGQGALAICGSRSVNLGGLAAGLWPNPGTGNWVDFNVRPPSAVSLNLTAANEQNFGFLTAYPTGGAFPPTSSLNYQPAAAVANAALVKLGTGGAMTVFSSAQSDFLLDVNGYFTGP